MKYRVFLPLLLSSFASPSSHCFLPGHFSRLWCRINDSPLFVDNLMFVWDKKKESILDSPPVSLPSLHPFRFLLSRREKSFFSWLFSRTEKKEGNYLDRKERGHLLWCLCCFLIFSILWKLTHFSCFWHQEVYCLTLWHPLCFLLSCLCHFWWKEACFRHFE